MYYSYGNGESGIFYLFCCVFQLVFVALGAWWGNRIYKTKGQNPQTGAIVGGILGLFSLLGMVVLFIIQSTMKDSTQVASYPPQGQYVQGYQPQPPQQPMQPPQPPPPAPPTSDKAKRLQDAKALFDGKLISEQEYNEMRAKILNS